jgi:hypothetical protein
MRKIKPGVKNVIKAGLVILAGVGIAVWYLFTQKFADTEDQKSAYAINALDLIKEFKKNDSIANKKYAEKIINVTGIVTEIEAADTTVNIKSGDTATGSYAIFAFQQQHLNDAQ